MNLWLVGGGERNREDVNDEEGGYTSQSSVYTKQGRQTTELQNDQKNMHAINRTSWNKGIWMNEEMPDRGTKVGFISSEIFHFDIQLEVRMFQCLSNGQSLSGVK